MVEIALFVAPFAAVKLSAGVFRTFLLGAGLVRKNYRGKKVPTGFGILIGLWHLFFLLLLRLAISVPDLSAILVGYALLVVGGVLDDALGWEDIKGLRGHFTAFLAGRVTTGFIKAVVGFWASFFIAVSVSADPLRIVLDTFLLALMINFVNLLDLRPGRAIKVFLLGVLPAVLSATYIRLLVLPILGIVLAYLPFELEQRVMLGDTGAALLGLTLGVVAVLSLPASGSFAVVVFLLAVHLYAEYGSLTQLISSNRVLDFLDRLGR